MFRTFFRIICAALLVAVLTAGCAPSSSPASGPLVRVDVPANPVRVNDIIRVPVSAANVANLAVVEVHLSFDKDVLEVTGLSAGSFVTADYTVQNTFDNNAGTIDYAVAQINRPTAQGSGPIFEIAFRVKAQGEGRITFRSTAAAPAGALLGDPDGKPITVTLVDGAIKAVGENGLALP